MKIILYPNPTNYFKYKTKFLSNMYSIFINVKYPNQIGTYYTFFVDATVLGDIKLRLG